MHKHLKNWGENSEIGSLASLLCVGNGNGMLCRGIPVRVVPLSLRNPLAPPPNNRYRVLTWRLRNCLWRDRDIFKGCQRITTTKLGKSRKTPRNPLKFCSSLNKAIPLDQAAQRCNKGAGEDSAIAFLIGWCGHFFWSWVREKPLRERHSESSISEGHALPLTNMRTGV